jgi:hypothetical protein
MDNQGLEKAEHELQGVWSEPTVEVFKEGPGESNEREGIQVQVRDG